MAGVQVEVPIETEKDVIRARHAVRDMAVQLGFGVANQTRLATAVSELVRNVLKYANSGTCKIIHVEDPSNTGIRVTVEDQGPGIADIELAMTDGFSTGNSLGAGLPGAKRLVQNFDITSKPGQTRITISMYQPKDLDKEAAIRRPGGRAALTEQGAA